MGSFWGHVDEGLFFILLAIWWMLHAFREYILAESKGTAVKPRMSYEVVIRRPIPIEILFKLAFPVVGFMAEFLEGGIRFQDADGNFVKLVYQQHMTIYGIFVIHSVVDLLTFFKMPIFPSLNYMTAFMAFTWYGIAFYYHATMHGKMPMETNVHVLPIHVMFAIGLAIVLESRWRQGVWTMVVRSYGLLTLGTWFTHVAFMLYVSDRFPGGESSTLDRHDPNNVTYVTAMFGMHLFVNLIISLAIYCLVYVTLRLRFGVRIHMDTDQMCKPVGNGSLPVFAKQSNGFHRTKKQGSSSNSEDSVLLLDDQPQPL